MKNKIFKFLIIISLSFLFSISIFPVAQQKTFSANVPTITLSVSSDVESEGYTAAVYLINQTEDIYVVYFVVNNVSVLGNNNYDSYTISLEKGKEYEVYAKIVKVVSGKEIAGSEIYSSNTIIIKNNNIINSNNGTKENENIGLEIFLKTILPIIIIVTFVALAFVFANKKQKTKLDIIIDNLNQIKIKSDKIIEKFKDEKFTEKRKIKKYKFYLFSIKKNISSCISLLINLNIDSMGQHNSLINNMLNFESVIKAAIKTSSTIDILQSEKFVKKLCNKLLPNVLKNAEEIKSAETKLKISTSNLFVQHSHLADKFKNAEDYDKYLQRTIFAGDEEDDD